MSPNAVLRYSADSLSKKLSQVEEDLIQVNMKGSEANLAFPNMLNEEFDSFAASVESADSARPGSSIKMLDGRQQKELENLNTILKTDLPAFNEFVRKHNIPLLYLRPSAIAP